MVRSLGLAVALAFAAPALLLPTATQAADRTAPMKFELRLQGPAEICGGQCALLISASGAITADTPRDFKQFARNRDLRNATVVFDSDGGSVLGAIALGRDIRRLALSTTVGRVIDIVATDAAGKSGKDETRFGEPAAPRATLSPRGDCESMCAFVLLGGVKRMVPPEARVRVHQIWLGDRREDPTAANYSAEDMVLVQRDIGKLAQYTIEMGASVDLLDLALRIPPWEPMHAMTRAQLVATGLMTKDPAAPPAPATAAVSPPAPAAAVQPAAPKVTSGTQATPISDRRWSVVERGGVSTLARRHPLTVEGETIGSFDLALACSADGDSYDFSYVERRYGAADKPSLAPLSGVTLRVGRALAPLKVVTSERRTETGELVSFASGTLSAGVVGGFAGAGNQAMIIETRSEGVVTVIRLGNTGARQDFPQLAGGCSKTPGARAGLPARNAGAYAAAQ
ncbi:MAG: hypothetical protein Q8M26_12260 [Pseudolabrys sp.]|nr:hypothetical protein [Pseudolabrys sp.]